MEFGPSFGEFEPNNRGQTGSRYIYIYTLYIFILFDICDLYISQEPDLLFGFPYLYKPTFALLTTYFAALFYCVLFNNRNPYEKKNKKLPIKPTKP